MHTTIGSASVWTICLLAVGAKPYVAVLGEWTICPLAVGAKPYVAVLGEWWQCWVSGPYVPLL